MGSSPEKWNHRYDGKLADTQPCALLSNLAHHLSGSKALDLACGLGGNAFFLAERGFHCEAIDFSEQALNAISHSATQRQLPIACHQQDLEQHPQLAHQDFDVVVISYFLYRPLFPAIRAALKPGGLLYYQTFNGLRAEKGGPRSPEFLLQENELSHYFSDFDTLFYSEDYFQQADQPAITAGVFKKPLAR